MTTDTLTKTRAPMITPLEKRLMLDASLPVIAGQVLWLDAADKTTILDAEGDNANAGGAFSGSVRTWVDKSGSGFNVTQATAANRPTYNATGLNGNGVLTFDGTNDKLTNTAASIAGNDYTMFVVFERSIATGRDGVVELGNGGSRNALFVNDSANKLGLYANGTFFNSTNVYTPGTYEVVTMMHDATAINLWRNGVNEITATGSTRATTTGIYVGDDSSGGDELNGHIAEIIVYDRDLTADERRDVENYLATKWGRTISINAAPTVATNTGATVSQSDPVTITAAMLSSTDSDNTDSRLIYKITDLADHGTLTNTNTAHTYILGETFAQSDIDNGYIVYTHGGSANFTDSFSFTVTDQYATTSATTFNLTITPDNVAPVINGWTLVSSEDFQSGATGWSDNTTEVGGTYLTRFLGRHSMEGGAQNTYKTYTLSGTESSTVIEFDMYKMDSWDGEFFRVFINDSQVINLSFINNTFSSPADGSSGIVTYNVQEMTPFLANFAFGSWNEQIFRFTLTINNANAGNVKLGFSSTLDQAVSDESWGVDNIKVYEVGGAGTPGPFNVVENNPIGTVVGRINATDANVGDTITYSVAGGTGASIFAINASTGIITTTAAINYEAISSYTLDIRATDNGTGSLFDAKTITITVVDMPENTAPTTNALGPISIAENTANGTVIGTMTGNDAEGNTITWSITGGNTDNIFAINSATGAIRVNSNTNLNYEWDNSYTLTIQAQDNGFGALSSTRNVTVNITNVNEAPTFNIPQSFLNQNPYLRYNATTGNFYQYVSTTTNYAAATTAASATLLNGVAGHIATISDAAENAYVRGLGSGALWLGASDATVEGEWVWAGNGPEGGQIFSLGSVAQGGFYTNWTAGQPDNGANSDFLEMAASGQWTDVNGGNRAYVIEWEGTAVMAALGNGPFTLAENPALNQSVGFVHARDVDAGDTLTYSITGGTGAANFAVNSSTGEITVTNPSAINYESATSFTLDVRVQDVGGLFSTQTVTINITDVNEAPTLNPGGPYTVAENSANNTLVATMTASDPDANALTWSITSGNDRGIFSVNNTGQIRIASNMYLDYELASSHTLTVRVSDGSLTSSQTITINLTDVQEAPSFDAIQRVLNADPTLRYNATTGNFYRFVASNANYAGAIAAATSATINGQAGYLVNVDSLAESNFIRTIMSNTIWIDGSDAAVEGEWRYSTGPNAGQMFWLGAAGGAAQNGYYTNWSAGEPNNSGGNEDGIEFRTNGTWNDTNVAGSRFYVIEWNGASILAAMQNTPQSIDENSALNSVVGTIHANDPEGGAITYSIMGGSGASVFSLDANTGQIRLISPINYESTTSYTLNVRAEDPAGLFNTMTITINVNDINDVPHNLILSANHIVENSAIGTTIGDLTSFDEDPADTHIYSIISNPGAKFILVGNQLRTAADIDYEQNQSFSIVLRTDDGNGGTLDRTFMITVGDQMDTFTPPPVTGSAGGIDPYVPPEEEMDSGPIDLLGTGLQGEQAQGRSFYSNGWQVLRENITFKIREMLSFFDDTSADLKSLKFGIDDAKAITELEAENATLEAHYTNLREALEFLQQLEKIKEGDDKANTADEARAKELPDSAIDRQFVDVMTYHQDRAARLREALMGA